ncbi:MAG: substrate-binding domain-containing protein, partial [Geminicoccaceae bacterium]
ITTESLGFQSNDQVRQVTLRLAEAGKRALVIPVGDKTTIDDQSLRALDYQVDAIVVMGGSVSADVVDLLTAASVPLFLFGRDREGDVSVGVSCDNAGGGAIAARYLLRVGRQRLAYLGKKAHTFAARSRCDGFVDELRRQGVALHDRAEDDSTYDGGRRAASALFSKACPPDAVFCFNDMVAMGAMQAAREFRLRIPEDVAIIGFDNLPMAAWHVFDLTTIACDPDALARLTVEKIRVATEGGQHQPGTFHVQPELVVRRTTP